MILLLTKKINILVYLPVITDAGPYINNFLPGAHPC